MQLVLGAGGARRPPPPGRARAPTRCSRRIQADVRADRAPPGAPLPAADERPLLDADDRSVQVHACHGRARQVEVLRDAILHLLEDDPTLEPRDVIVMCPDIETFAPLIQATFGAGEVTADEDEADALPDDVRPPDLRVRLADRSLRQTNPVLGVVARLLELAGAAADRVAGARPRRPRAGPAPLPARRRRPRAASRTGSPRAASAGGSTPRTARRSSSTRSPPAPGARGSTAARRRHDDRGRASGCFGGVLPLDDVDSGAIDLAGRFAELVDRLRRGARRAQRAADDRRVGAAIADAADALTATGRRDAWQRAELQRLLDDVVARGRGEAARPTLALPEVRALLAERLQGRPTRANFRTGHLTICTLVPMRSVPHRVVCLLGLDDGVFPRKAPRDGDDLMLADPHVGDRDPRTRGPPAAARRAAGGDRPADRHLHRQRRAHERAAPARRARSASCSTSSTARSARTTAGRASASSSATRCSRSTRATSSPGALVAGRTWSFDARHARGRAGAGGRARARSPPFLARSAAGPAAGARRARRPRALRPAPGARVPAPAARHQRRRLRRRGRRRAAASSSTALEKWGVGQRLLDGAARRRGDRRPRRGRDRARRAAARACSASR